ncbi:hypothetical protein NE237_000984 [Protea cynaroides]|uniref:Protein kinase domain-containing protein n=1 Tax=Protea cynaroides TaxID=273540 RepID=A0A9Q0KSB0_9MAGN|nr:hypothetical protein NE237_000984 [Protea cynaroides]
MGFAMISRSKHLYMNISKMDLLTRFCLVTTTKLAGLNCMRLQLGQLRGWYICTRTVNRGLIHYDIKPGNILLDSNFCPKVADFGLAKFCNKESHVTMSGGRGTPGYAAPELWMPLPVTYKCDVYSFGMMLFEIVGRRRNFEVNQGESQQWFPRRVWEKFENGELSEMMVLDCKIEEEDREKAEVMCKVGLWCVQYLPEARPSMRTVLKILEGGVQIPVPPNPFQHLISSGVEATVSMESAMDSSKGGSDIENSSGGFTSQSAEN